MKLLSKHATIPHNLITDFFIEKLLEHTKFENGNFVLHCIE